MPEIAKVERGGEGEREGEREGGRGRERERERERERCKILTTTISSFALFWPTFLEPLS